MPQIVYTPRGVCSRSMVIEYQGDVITNVTILGGCPGNLLGISRLIVGMKIQDVIARFEGVKCGVRGTSCPDQLVQALKLIQK